MRIGLFGLGTVGRGLLELLRQRTADFEVVAICDRSFQKKKEIIGNIPATTDMQNILQRNDIDVYVELMGGIDTPLFVVRSAIDKKIPVVTANKALLAQHGFSLFSKALLNNVNIGFEASVAGAIPIIRNLQNAFAHENILRLEGILNGTTNYILTRMRKEKKNYEDILQEAQKLGLAEADPSLDVNGTDAAQKLSLLASLISHDWADVSRVYIRGIEDVNLTDVLWAERMQYRIRLIARLITVQGGTYLSVEPSLITDRHFLWDIEMENNAILLTGQFSGDHLFMGKGAGSLPTAYSVLSDLYELRQGNMKFPFHKEPAYLEISNILDLEYAFYTRLTVLDQPGVLAAIAQILANNAISIASVHQEADPSQATGNYVDLIILTHEAKRENFSKALNEITHLTALVKKVFHMPLLD